MIAECLLAEQDARYKPDLNAFDKFVKEAIFISTAGARPAATGRVGEAEKAKYDPERAVPTKHNVVGTDLYPNIVYCVEGTRRRSASEGRG